MTNETPAPAEATLGHNNPPEETTLEKMLREMSERNVDVLVRAQALLKGGKNLPAKISETPNPDETAEKVTTLIQQLTTCINKVEKARETEKAPHLAAGKMVDTFFNANKVALTAVKTKALAVLKVHVDALHAAEVEAQRKAAETKAAEARTMTTVAAALEGVNVGASESALEEALQSEEVSIKHEKAAEAKTGLVAVRSESGATAALRGRQVITIDDLNKLDLETLRFLIPLPALQQAANAFLRQGGTELAGCTIKTETSLAVR